MQRWRLPVRAYSCVLGLSMAGLGAASGANPGFAQEPGTDQFDILLTGGRVIDGTGNPWFRADVGVRGDRIVAIGNLANAGATRRIDVEGRFIVPGFIDIHSHADEGLDAENTDASGERRRAAPNLVSQGITTVVINQDGRSAWPIAEQRAKLERLRIGPNAGLMVGHNSIRAITLGDDHRRPATVAEVDRMRAMVRQAMGEGAYGLSAGLEYVPGRWSTTEEVVALVREVGVGGVYIVHERSSGLDPMWFWPSHDPPGPPTMLHTILEDIEIAERTGVTTVATHIKARGANFWGSGRALINLIERARERGVPIWADQYPYNTTGSDGTTVLIPEWFTREVTGDGRGAGTSMDFASALGRALTDPEVAVDLRRDIAHEIQRRGGPPNLIVFEFPDSSFIGKNLGELATDAGLDPVEMAIRLQLEGYADRPGGARIRGFSLSEIDIEAFAAQPWMATATDAGIALPGDGPVHARYYGTFPRKIRRYALERGALSVEDAIRSATSLPALILGMNDRGLVREGFHADLAVLNLETIRDRATFFQPHQMAEGVDYVLINGTIAVDAGELTYALPGRVLTPDQGRRTSAPNKGGAR